MGVTGGHQGCEKFRDVIGASSFHGDVDGGVAEIDAVVGAVVGSLDNVGAVGRAPRSSCPAAAVCG